MDEKLERITALLELARELTETLATGETVETEEDADHAIKEAERLAREILAQAKE